MRYIFRLLVATDIWLNVLIGGQVGETLSGSAYRGELKGKLLPRFFRPIIDFLASPWEKEHCFNAYLSDAIRK
jgi:hypothetical protein